MVYVLVALGGLVALMAALQLFVRLRARALAGKPLPELPRAWTKKLGRNTGALLYFFSPSCGACRTITPRMTEMSRRRPTSVFVVNVADDLELARALKVMATPSVVEVADGKIVGYHVGPAPSDVLARYA